MFKISIVCYQILLPNGLGLFSLNCFSTCTSLVGVIQAIKNHLNPSLMFNCFCDTNLLK
jgi:hypothetical protein